MAGDGVAGGWQHEGRVSAPPLSGVRPGVEPGDMQL